jgi:hypothetical protein
MFTVYAEKEIFENIVLFNDTYPNWYKIFSNHSEVCLNITDADLDAELIQGTPIFEYIMANAGKEPIALKDFFDDIHLDKSIVAEKPRAAFLLSYPKVETDAMQNSYGVIVQSQEDIDDNLLKGTFFRDLPQGLVLESQVKKGWAYLFDFPMLPSNSMVITDDFLFTNQENGQVVGKFNLIQLVDSILPHTLDIDYHLSIFSSDNGNNVTWCRTLTNEIKTAITALRPYTIIIEMVFADTIHKRKFLLNYINATADKGFALLKISDGKTVRNDNDIRFDKAFNRLEPHEGDTDYFEMKNVLTKLKMLSNDVKLYINHTNTEVSNRRILGDCNPDKSLKNRLINDV